MRTSYTILVVLFLSVLLLPSAQAGSCTSTFNLVSNCGFETGDFTSWTLTGNDVPGELGNLYGVEGMDPFPLPGGTNPNSGAFQAFFADQFLDPTTLSQTLTTTPGTMYLITFYFAQELLGPGIVNNSLTLTFGGTTLTTLTNVPAQGYTLVTATGTATSASTVVSLSFGNDIGEFLLDDLSVSTPEPGSSLLFLSGGALLALLFSRRLSAQKTA